MTKNKKFKTNGKSKFIRNRKKTVFLLIMLVVLTVYSLSLIFPLSWALFSSLKSHFDFEYDAFSFVLSDGLQFGNILSAFTEFAASIQGANGAYYDVGMVRMLFYSIAYSGGVALVANFTRSLCAYVCARYKNVKFTRIVYGLVIVLMTISFPSNIAVTIKFYKMMGMYNNLLLTIVLSISFGGAHFLFMYAAYVGLSKEYSEAAQIDGANQFQVMFRVMMPMVKNIFWALVLLEFIAHWNDYNPNVVFLSNYPMLSFGLLLYQNNTSEIPKQLAACMIVMLPTLILFIIFKEKIMSNLSVGGLKG